MAFPRVDLPDPDSPTNPIVVFLYILIEVSFTA